MGNKELRKPGELGFALFALVLSLLFLTESIRMFAASPELSSYSGFPLILSILMTLFMAKIFLTGLRTPGDKPKDLSLASRLARGLGYAFSRDVALFIGAILLYCLGLFTSLGFVPCTVLFLFVTMQYFMPQGFKLNILYTMVLTVSVYVVFKLIFRVQLP